MNRKLIVIGLLILGLPVAVITAFCVGSDDLTLSAVWDSFQNYDKSSYIHYTIVHLRGPRVVMAFMAGASLSLAGYLIQSLVNNPLADPYILGTASGGALGANLCFAGILPVTAMGIYLPPWLAFVGALVVTLLVMFIASRGNHIRPFQLILGGVAFTSLITSIVSVLVYLSDSEEKLRTIIFWAMGSLDKADWGDVFTSSIFLALALVVFGILHPAIALLLLGSERARSLGVSLKSLSVVLIIGSSLLTAMVVATCGPIGFVGLVVPHFVRALLGVNGRFNVIFVALLGGLFLLLCDIVARWVLPPVGLPIGIIASFVGIPLFIYLLSRSKYSFH